MAGVMIQLNAQALPRLGKRLQRMAEQFADLTPLYESLGAEGETQTRRRITDEKSGPDGEAWPAWSEKYARTRHSNHSLLQNDDHLLGAVHFDADSHSTEWGVGEDIPYAAHQQFGGAETGSNIPARPYLGVSEENAADLERIVDDFVTGILEA